MKVPKIGETVHYVAYGTPGGEYQAGAHRAAIITAVTGGSSTVALCILNPTGMFFNVGVYYDPEAREPGSWHWPED